MHMRVVCAHMHMHTKARTEHQKFFFSFCLITLRQGLPLNVELAFAARRLDSELLICLSLLLVLGHRHTQPGIAVY